MGDFAQGIKAFRVGIRDGDEPPPKLPESAE
jgi:hypothetical protein